MTRRIRWSVVVLLLAALGTGAAIIGWRYQFATSPEKPELLPLKRGEAADSGHAGAGSGQGGIAPGWNGLETGRCGSKLELIDTAGEVRQYQPPDSFLLQFPVQEMPTGESMRKAVLIPVLMEALNARKIRLTACDGRTLEIGTADSGERLLVLTGRGVVMLGNTMANGLLRPELRSVYRIRILSTR